MRILLAQKVPSREAFDGFDNPDCPYGQGTFAVSHADHQALLADPGLIIAPARIASDDERVSTDSLSIELEEALTGAWWKRLIAGFAVPHGGQLLRFAGWINGERRYTSATFPAERPLGELPPQEAWAPGMTQALDELRTELERDGWVQTGRGTEAWAYRYQRQAPVAR